MLRALTVLALLAGCAPQPSERLIAECKLEAAQLANTADPPRVMAEYFDDIQLCVEARGYELRLDRPGCLRRARGSGDAEDDAPVNLDDPVGHPVCYVRAPD